MKLKLIHKLLIAMFACTALVLVLVTLATRASIGQGFVNFLQQQELSQVKKLVPEIAGWYRTHGSWQELTNNPRQFYMLAFQSLVSDSGTQLGLESGPDSAPSRGWRRGQGSAGAGPPGAKRQGTQGGLGPPPGAGRRNALPQRVYLLDNDMNAVIGQIPDRIEQDALIPVDVDGTTVGWLGVTAIYAVKLPEEQAFISQLRKSLLIGLGFGLVIAALLAWFLARHLSRPVNEVAEGISALAKGDFNYRLKTKGGDEIARLGDDVNRLSSVLSEHETARKRWMSDMAHELRTPLAIISGELEAMSDGIRPLSMEQLSSVQDEVKHLALLVDDLHSLTLTESGALAYKMQGIDLNEVVQMAVDSFQRRAQDKDLELRWENPDQPVILQGDEQRLRQLLNNLLDNAVRYTDAGGFISIVLGKERRNVNLVISDSAPGASEKECEHLFERLYRVEGSRNRNSGGSGLGLAICRNIVEAHGGKISARPSPYGGLEITTTIPLNA